jgi:lycopene cyclase domain-containing protein
MTYTWLALAGLAVAVGVDLLVLRTNLVLRKAFWTAYPIMFGFQLVVDGLLTGLPVVQYDAARILGWHLLHAPVEDFLFGFAMIELTLSIWTRLGARERHHADR